jgi:hypothetical protein
LNFFYPLSSFYSPERRMHVQWLLYGDREGEIILEEKNKEGGTILVVAE